MAEAAFWGLVAASTLILGALLSVALPWPRRAIGLVTGFGAGALISAVYGSGNADVPTPIGALRPEPRSPVAEPIVFEADASLDDLAAQRG